MRAAYYLGLMSGTSLDGLDIALCRFNDDGRPELKAATTVPLPAALKQGLWALTQPSAAELDQFGYLDRSFAIFCADAINDFLTTQEIATQAVVAIGSHGQTVRHRPDSDPRFSIQLGCAATIAALTGIDVIANFRQKDIALGGQGAPLAPAFHRALFHQPGKRLALVNIGGIANATIFDTNGNMTGFDTGPGNGLMDSWYQLHHPEAPVTFDHGGGWARQGKINSRLLQRCLADPYFSRKGPKSTGREYFQLSWLHNQLRDLQASPADTQRTLLELSAQTIAQPLLQAQPETCYLCGGGAHNRLLQARLDELLPDTQVASSAAIGVDPDTVEALAFAWLAWCFVARKPIQLSEVTGAGRNAILGALYPAA